RMVARGESGSTGWPEVDLEGPLDPPAPSNTEPILRIIAEAPDLAEAQTLVQEMKKRIGI
ncbi:MAG: hypothetical protein UZ16_OP3001003350, partial [Candidatus Hinthialibacteria bacterium OLB16]